MRDGRLLANIKPSHYWLNLAIDEEFTATTGHERMSFQLIKPTRKLVFHAVGLSISEVRLDGETKPRGITRQDAARTVTFEFSDELDAGDHELEVDYSGTVGEGLHGLYRSQFVYQGSSQRLAVTQFEAVHAREVFVCIDEPSAKARFDIRLTVPAGLTALSNMNAEKERTLPDGRLQVEFATTPIMSSYLVALVIGQLESVERVTESGVLIRVFATPGHKDQLKFALDAAVRVLEFFNGYFNIPYPLPKLDLVAVPDFAAGAMENWGLVTFRETALLLDPTETSLANRQRVADVIAHEAAHQWFGDLVTLAWWDDVWLNEGFASWASDLAMAELWPEWEVWTKFIEDETERAKRLDSLVNTHPIQVEVKDPFELDGIFDAISYSKGASILNMLHQFLGTEVFRRGLRRYLLKHKYANTTTTDLWRALEVESHQPVERMMASWTERPGYPLLEVRGDTLMQQRFFRYGSPQDAGREAPWPVPFQAIDGGHAPTEAVLMESNELPAGGILNSRAKPNPGQTAFYRFLYAPKRLAEVSRAIRAQEMAPEDRYGVVSDLAATTEAGRSGSRDLLGFLAGMRSENNYVVWGSVASAMSSLAGIFDRGEERAAVDRFNRWLAAPNARRLGWSGIPEEPAFDQLMRPLILIQSVQYGDEEAIAQALNLFDDFRSGRPVHPDVRPVALFAAARQGGEAEFQVMLRRYLTEPVPQVKINLLTAMGAFKDVGLIRQYLEMGLSGQVRPQDIHIVVASAFGSYEARGAAWDWLKSHWSQLVERYGQGGHMLERFPLQAARAFSTEEKAREMEEFFHANSHPAILRPVAQALEIVRGKSAWYARDASDIRVFLDQFSYND